MTCTRAQAIIESASFMDWAAAELDAAHRHAQECEACRPLLASETELLANLQALSTALETPDVTSRVMARIASDASRSVAANVRPDSGATPLWLPVAGVVALGLVLGILDPLVLERMPALYEMDVSSRDFLQPAFTLVSVALYLIALLVPMRRPQNRTE